MVTELEIARDKLIYDSTQWDDQDGGGYGDNPSGNNPDGCISQFGNSTENCLWMSLTMMEMDTPNNGDGVPGFASQWNDSDWDGYGDNINGYKAMLVRPY